MKNLIISFFSFEKLMKEKLVIVFFWLAVVVWGLDFFDDALSAISFEFLAAIVGFVKFFVTILFALVLIRLCSELSVAIFRINDNLSPDGGASETASIDPIAEARKVAEEAAERARDAAQSVGVKTQAATKSARETVSNLASKSQKDDLDNNEETIDGETPTKPAPSRHTAPKNPANVDKPTKAATKKSDAAKSPKSESKKSAKSTASDTSQTKKSPQATSKKSKQNDDGSANDA